MTRRMVGNATRRRGLDAISPPVAPCHSVHTASRPSGLAPLCAPSLLAGCVPNLLVRPRLRAYRGSRRSPSVHAASSPPPSLPVRPRPLPGVARGEPMSLDVSPALLEQAERGEVDEADFVDCVRTSLPFAWEMISSLVAQLEGRRWTVRRQPDAAAGRAGTWSAAARSRVMRYAARSSGTSECVSHSRTATASRCSRWTPRSTTDWPSSLR